MMAWRSLIGFATRTRLGVLGVVAGPPKVVGADERVDDDLVEPEPGGDAPHRVA